MILASTTAAALIAGATSAHAGLSGDDPMGRAVQVASYVDNNTSRAADNQYSIASVLRVSPLATDKTRLNIKIEMVDGGPINGTGFYYTSAAGPQFRFSAADNAGNVRGTSTSLAVVLPPGAATGVYDKGWINLKSSEGPAGADFDHIPFCVIGKSQIVIAYSSDTNMFSNMRPNHANQKGYITPGGKYGLWYDVLPPNAGSSLGIGMVRINYLHPLYNAISCNTTAVLNIQPK